VLLAGSAGFSCLFRSLRLIIFIGVFLVIVTLFPVLNYCLVAFPLTNFPRRSSLFVCTEPGFHLHGCVLTCNRRATNEVTTCAR
jgi:hypothetical protein